MSLYEARKNAEDADREMNGEQEGYNGSLLSDSSPTSKCIREPKQGKSVFTLTKHTTKTRKWVTHYSVTATRGWDDNKVKAKLWFETQAEAVAYAKTEAVRSGCSVVVAQSKTCVSNNSTVGVVEVKGGQEGRWQFSGEGRC